MRNTYYEIYVHVVWSVKNREQMIKEDVERTLDSVIEAKVQSNKASILAIGSTMDHVHLLLSISPETNISVLVKEIKGTTSFYINHKTEGNLYWQDGYGALSVSKSGLDVVKKYIKNQKEHHEFKKGIIPILEKYSTT